MPEMLTSLALLTGAGFLSGTMNAVAGGGSFVSFPALILAGVPSVAANASSTVALFPGAVTSAWVYRRDLTGIGGIPLPALLACSLAGGLTGAILLLSTPVATFDGLVPGCCCSPPSPSPSDASSAPSCAAMSGSAACRRWRCNSPSASMAAISVGRSVS